MGNYKDLTNHKFVRLTCLKPVGRDRKGIVIWLCKCECGNTTEARSTNLRNGTTKSCGCLKKDRMREMMTTHALSSDSNGKIPRLYRTWANMKRRCLSPTAKGFQDYGGRGISVCDEWLEYKPFYDWALSNGYSDGLTIERINNNGNYEPGNCKWITPQKQARNKRNNVFIIYNGQRKTIAEWSEVLGISLVALYHRIERGWSIERAFTQPLRTNKNKCG